VLESWTLRDARREPRFNVHWRARLQLLNGHGVDVSVKDISGSGMGLVGSELAPADATLAIRVRVPDLRDPAQGIDVAGTVKVAYVALRGYEFAIGVTWIDRSDADRELMSRWIRRLSLRF
jgi:PilZ domain